MRLLYITDALAVYGGVERVLTQKVNWLAEHNYEVCVLTVNQGNNPLCYSLHQNVQYDDLDILYYRQYNFKGWRRWLKRHKLDYNFNKRLSDKLKDFAPDLIICARLDYVHNIIKVKGETSFVFESHSSCMCESFENDSFFRKIYMLYLKLSLKKADMIVALTEGDAVEWRRYSSHVCVIPNVVSLNPNSILSDCSSKSALFVGRYSNQKDIGSLLKIWSTVNNRYPEWQLNIYGGYGAEKQKWLNEIERCGANIVVHDSTSEIINKYKENSILLLTSKYEPFGLVLPEAMSCGIPVVAFDCPYGPQDIISDARDGFLIKDRNIPSFVEKVCLLIDDKELRRKMGKAGAQSARRYDKSQIMPVWDNLFKKLLKS